MWDLYNIWFVFANSLSVYWKRAWGLGHLASWSLSCLSILATMFVCLHLSLCHSACAILLIWYTIINNESYKYKLAYFDKFKLLLTYPHDKKIVLLAADTKQNIQWRESFILILDLDTANSKILNYLPLYGLCMNCQKKVFLFVFLGESVGCFSQIHMV